MSGVVATVVAAGAGVSFIAVLENHFSRGQTKHNATKQSRTRTNHNIKKKPANKTYQTRKKERQIKQKHGVKNRIK